MALHVVSLATIISHQDDLIRRSQSIKPQWVELGP
jgi:hypothetical protein